MIIIKSREDIAKMRVAGRCARVICETLAAHISPGITTKALDTEAAELMRNQGVQSAFLGYRGYPGTICISVNEEVVHGIPGPRRIAVGDIIGIDVGVVVDGFNGDTALTVMVGVTDPDVIRLVEVTKQALQSGIAQAHVGRRLSDVSHAIEQTATAAGFSVVRDFVGHGIGRKMHEDPQIPNYGPAGKGPKLLAGMTLAIEPMVNLGGAEVCVLGDGWTVVTRDRRPSAHFEHTIVVGETAADILTDSGAEKIA
ncbi:MAG: type I methionyl aminopeptidase [Kiritimatiellae bacterium]|nr:type I methionyl aminopeptidase [Kiritimatiellia bacterium]